MTIVDVNILVYAHNVDAPEHAMAWDWLTSLFDGPDEVGLPWISLWGFLRVSTNPRVFPNPLAAQQAFATVRSWLKLSNVVIVQPGPRHAEILERLVMENQAAGPLLTDAALAALALEHGAVIASTDNDFARFREIRWVNPLEQRVN